MLWSLWTRHTRCDQTLGKLLQKYQDMVETRYRNNNINPVIAGAAYIRVFIFY